MQSGNLTGFLFKQYHLSDFSFKKIYYFLARKLTGLNASIQKSDFDKFKICFHSSEDINSIAPVLRELNPVYVMVKEKVIDYKVNVKNFETGLKVVAPNINNMTPIDNKVKWKNHNLEVINIIRNYPLVFKTELRNPNIEEITLPEVFKIDYDKIRLEEKVKVVEEIITMSPYVKNAARSVLLKIPVIKSPLFKSHFSEEEMDIFRESLALRNKTKKTNVVVSHIYDKFSIELFSSIKQEPNSKKLICYLNSKLQTFDKNKLYYLLIGQRKDNKITIKALSSLNR